MNVEAQEKAIKDLGEEIKSQLVKINGQIKENGEANSDTKKELEGLATKYSAHQKALDDFIEKSSKRMDELDEALQAKVKELSEKKTIMDYFAEELKKSDSFKNEKKALITLDETKAPINMLQSNALTGRVIEYDRQAGLITPPVEEVRARSLFGPAARTLSNTISYLERTGLENGMGTVAEGVAGAKTSFTLTERTDTVKKVSTYVQVSDEMLDDIPQLLGFMQATLFEQYALVEDAQLLTGSGLTTNIEGVYTSATAYNDGGFNVANGNFFDVLRIAAKQLRVGFYRANAMVVSPTTKMEMDLTKDSQGRYLLPNVYTGAPMIVGGIRVIEHTAIADNTALIGDFTRGAQIFDRSDITLEIADQDGTDFVDGFKKLKLTKRLGLAKYRSAAFVKITDLDAAVTALGV